ncbi:hypothetical protein [Rhizobium laguerreae]|uniref:Uncharacterized protein n=1 Tax=Rhizobium laguerreae TaxID=1076926 RepID=A0A7Y2W6N9_9HYPH|nr:hypothetical protein [Rhizobium laguerreae]NNH41933.1 hypothetical protein [Rhizobium laguerreae]NNH57143.1 hypothetical protein [Rhizobium laguerreae]NNH65464.1 hypothetical protein [Rhizobium laguerreae]
MDKLLNDVLDAHGGLENWSKVTKVTAMVSLHGPFWEARGWPDVYMSQTVVLDPHHEHITFAPFTATDRMSVLDVWPERVKITDLRGNVIEERANPRASFPAPFEPAITPWNAIQVAYFTSAAVWNYLTAPFVFARPDVVAHEIAPWIEGEETWRRLAVTFPEAIANHNADQVFYYDDTFMLRRMDYSPDVTGKPPVAHYAYDHKSFDGFVFPTRRLVHLHDPEGVADHGFAPIAIDVTSVKLD